MANPIIKLAFSPSLTVLSLVCCLTAPHAISQTQSVKKLPIETEAQRLDAVRILISQEKSRRLGGGPDGKPKSSAAFCERMLDDLLNHKDFKAIEPVAVLDFDYPIWNLDLPKTQRQKNERIAAKKLGPTLNNNLQHCAVDEGANHAWKFFGFNGSAGAPPFRVYVLPERVNPFPESQLVYWSEYVEKTGSGRKGYSWVNLDICAHTNGISVWTDSMKLRNDYQGQQSALTSYQGKLVAWDMTRNVFFGAEQIEPKRETQMKSKTFCLWETYAEETVNK
ncbi:MULTISPECIES: hypothetical protein [unclassified Marinobacter]|jgi:hypothetical protein|uniref:hypothetical protein n=1 Tax=unclassified Marinobacter TaxID=83889 RepID=UPI00200FAB08|nr:MULTISPECIES: hypothetical protein [unclassified Marinobacter]MCL1481103.1 hypothetical protein [Marinobacter sp.]MCL1488026.1 hypothetical protein [Marinobacter sp.]UQG56062.1 hypothetical protein MIH16_22195 [Marinobacter sp. M4C]UQG64866.1 hypothetical protein MIH17_22190 [Marinobacter sp. M2C]UQG69145.1 hypothetical protein MIH19_22200 [Marinobacter sp. M1C]